MKVILQVLALPLLLLIKIYQLILRPFIMHAASNQLAADIVQKLYANMAYLKEAT